MGEVWLGITQGGQGKGTIRSTQDSPCSLLHLPPTNYQNTTQHNHPNHVCVDIGREQPSAQQRMQQQKKRDDSEGPRAAAATAATTAAASLITMNNKNPGVAPNQALPTDDEVPPFSELRGSRSNTNTSTNLISPRSYRKIKSLRAKLMADANHSPYQKKAARMTTMRKKRRSMTTTTSGVQPPPIPLMATTMIPLRCRP